MVGSYLTRICTIFETYRDPNTPRWVPNLHHSILHIAATEPVQNLLASSRSPLSNAFGVDKNGSICGLQQEGYFFAPWWFLVQLLHFLTRLVKTKKESKFRKKRSLKKNELKKKNQNTLKIEVFDYFSFKYWVFPQG